MGTYPNPPIVTGTPNDGDVVAFSAALGEWVPVPQGVNQAAVTASVNAAVNALVNGAPGALDTLKELADAINDDASFAATVTAALAAKQPLDPDLTAIAALLTTSFGRSLLTLADAAAVRTAIDAQQSGTSLALVAAPSGGDDTAALNAAMAAAAASGAREFRVNGDYLISSGALVIPAGLIVVGKEGYTRFRQAWWSGGFGGFVTASGTYAGTDVTGAVLTADAQDGATTLTMTSTANLTAGTSYLLGADRSFNDSSAAGVGSNTGGANDDIRYRGEIVRIASIDSPTQVTVYGYVRDLYETAHAASLKAITYNQKAGIVGCILENTEPDAHISSLLSFSYCSDFLIEDCIGIGGDGPGFHLDMCLAGKVDVKVQDLTDNAGANRWGYGVLANRATEDVDIFIRAERGRHAFTTNGVDNKRGVPRNLRIRGVSDRSNDSAWDTHAQGADLVFDVTATNCRTSAFNDRAARTKWKGTAAYCNKGLALNYPASGAHALLHLSHIQGGTGCGVEFGTVAQCDVELHVDGSSGPGARFLTGATRNVLTGTIKNPGNSGTPAPAVLFGSGNTGVGNEVHIRAEAYASGGQGTRSTGAMTYPVDIQTTSLIAPIITDCSAVGSTNPQFVNDPKGTAVTARNRHLDKPADMLLEDDFVTSGTTSGNIGSLGWGRTNGTSTATASEASHPGIHTLSTNSVASTITVLNLGSILAGDFFDLTYLIRANSIDTDTRIRVGLSSNGGSDTPSNGIYFEKLEADTHWFLVTRSASSQTRADSGIAVGSGWTTLRVRRIDASTIGFTIGTAAEQTATGTVPAVSANPILQLLSATTAAKTCDIDKFTATVAALTR